MKVNFNVPLKKFNGENAQNDGKDLIIKDSLCNVLLNAEGKDGVRKYKLFKLADKIFSSEAEVDLSLEEAAIIKEEVGKLGLPLFVGRVFDLLGE